MTTVEEEKFVRSSLLLWKGSSNIAKKILKREEQKEIQENSRDLDDLLEAYKAKIEHEFKNHTQREILFPPSGKTDVEKWDISLLTGVLKIIFKSSLCTEEIEAVKKIRYHRNETFAHSATASLSGENYTRICDELKAAIHTLASGFTPDVKEECDRDIETCLSGPLDLKYLLEQFKKTSQTDDMFRQVLAKINTTGKETTDVLTNAIEKENSALEKKIREALSSSEETILNAIGDLQSKKQEFKKSDQEIQTEPLQDTQCTCSLSAEKVKAAGVDDRGEIDNEDDRGEIEDEDIILKDYQKELAGPAIDGKNVIIVAPTGSGKKTVAMAVMQEHLRQRKGQGVAKVIFLMNQAALAIQLGSACQEALKQYSTKVITGELQSTRAGLQDFLERNDILVVTAQKLLDALVSEEFSISKISLLIVDECHHTHAKHAFNHIMGRYMDLKLNETDIVLPQVVGLSASVGLSKVTNKEKAMEHIEHLMANLDAQAICIVQSNIGELRQHVSMPEEKVYIVASRENEEFKTNVIHLMKSLEKKMYSSSLVKDIPESCKSALLETNTKGTPQYAQWIFKLQQNIAKIKNPEAQRTIKLFTTHLELYNKALIINDDVGIRNAQTYLEIEMNKGEQLVILDENEFILHGAYKRLRSSKFPESLSPKLEMLSDIIQRAYRNNSETIRGILLVKTTDMCKAIFNWIEETPELRECNPVHIEGTYMTAGKEGISQAEQTDALQMFREGAHNLIVTTSIALEGLDISRCNLVIRYDLVTNAIVQIRSHGNDRTSYNKHVAEGMTDSAEKEELDMICEVMMRNAIIQLQANIAKYPKRFHRTIQELQDEAYRGRHFKGNLLRNGKCRIDCINCGHFICWSDDIKKMGRHLAVVHVRPRSSIGQDMKLNIFGKFICKMCGKELGAICAYKTFEFPLLQVKEVSVVDEEGRRIACKRWNMFPFDVVPLKEKDLKTSIIKNKDAFMM